MKNSIYLILVLIFSIGATAQAQTLHAVVANKETGEPISDAFIFLANSSIGTTTDGFGVF